MTTNISKIQAALASVTQETTVALFNLNLDCSLFKVDAPAEYLPFGNALTKRRRTQAEGGSAHRIARKLGMLFEGIVPHTPELIKAYGTRASEIIEFHEKRLPSTSSGKSDYGPFTDYVGVDGTSIWAAATSSGAAISMHLLACLLAVAFTAEESVAIWEQVVEVRKEEISKSEGDGLLGFRTLAASTWDIPRQDLATWDASVRAWIRSANTAKELQCYQLRIILDNIDLPVHTSVDTYRSVIETWQTCLKMMDSLVRGNGQDIQNGGLFVAFRAWHIFPDLILLKDQKHIKQNDPLVKQGGTVTIGLERANGQNSSGVNWSLSLSHLKFYGDSERREGYLNSAKERVSIPDVWAFLLGFCFRIAGTNMTQVERKLRIAALVFDLLLSITQDVLEYPNKMKDHNRILEANWVYRLDRAIKHYSGCTDEEKKHFRQMMQLGHKSSQKLWDSANGPFLPITVQDVASYLAEHHKGVLPKFLRGSVSSIFSTPYPYMEIIYRRSRNFLRLWEIEKIEIGSLSGATAWNSLSEFLSQPDHPLDQNLVACDITKTPVLVKCQGGLSSTHHTILEDIFGPFELCTVESRDELKPQSDSRQVLYITLGYVRFHGIFRSGYKPCMDLLNISDIEFLFREDLVDGEFTMQQLTKVLPQPGEPGRRVFRYFLDMGVISSLYEKFNTPLINLSHLATCFVDRYPARVFDHEDTYNIYREDVLSYSRCRVDRRVDGQDDGQDDGRYFVSGDALLWALVPKRMTQSEAFQWIHYLESKGQTASETYPLLMAISSEDSLFVASQLVQDPSLSIRSPSTIIRLPGNIGKPGIVLLVSPSVPRHPNHENTLVEDAPFDGQLIDCFGDTTLHLTLTGYELPLELKGGKSGARHQGAWIFEATTSVHVAGKWVGDINPLQAPLFFDKDLESYWDAGVAGLEEGSSRDPHVYEWGEHIKRTNNIISPSAPSELQRGLLSRTSPGVKNCPIFRKKHDSYKSMVQAQRGSNEDLTSIDSWDEYFHRPSNPTVFRSRNNWAARLAALCFSENIKAPVIPIDPETCKCSVEKLLHYSGPYASKSGPDDEWLHISEGVMGVKLPKSAHPSFPKSTQQHQLEYYPIYIL
ncbi:hypothetical protein TWF481_008247 [Arthrobotrys musiformis]|uniref:Uncharacterized protein n=1 Tax=Arthrobotrys musiformis TaxID=47236 RepID=A0AAV9W6J6_9PEZI